MTMTTSTRFDVSLSMVQGQVVPVAPLPPGNPYDRAVSAIAATRTAIHGISVRKGPDAVLNRFDRWAQTLSAFHRKDKGLAAVVGGGFMLVCGAVAAYYGYRWGIPPLLAGAGLGALGLGMVTSNQRTNNHRQRRETAQLESQDVTDMLAPYTRLSAVEQAMVHGFVTAELQRLDHALSPKAALTRDRLLAKPGCTPAPILDRVARLALTVEHVSRHGADSAQLDLLGQVIREAVPEERKQIAATLSKLFMRGERVTFSGSTELKREFYGIVDGAERGEAPAVKAS